MGANVIRFKRPASPRVFPPEFYNCGCDAHSCGECGKDLRTLGIHDEIEERRRLSKTARDPFMKALHLYRLEDLERELELPPSRLKALKKIHAEKRSLQAVRDEGEKAAGRLHEIGKQERRILWPELFQGEED